jgi:hypothetical protein
VEPARIGKFDGLASEEEKKKQSSRKETQKTPLIYWHNILAEVQKNLNISKINLQETKNYSFLSLVLSEG